MLIGDGRRAASAVFLGDVVPTAVHDGLPFIMGYDLDPSRTLETKRALLEPRHRGAIGW